jgi:hypothetical protein
VKHTDEELIQERYTVFMFGTWGGHIYNLTSKKLNLGFRIKHTCANHPLVFIEGNQVSLYL